LSPSASFEGSQQLISTTNPRQGGDSTPFKVPSFPSISSISRPTRSSDENDSSLQGIGELSPRLSQFFQPTQESPPPQITSSPHPRPHDIPDPIALAQPSPPPPELLSKYTPLAVIEARERQRQEEEAAAEANRRKEEQLSFSAVPEPLRRKWADEAKAHEIFEGLRNVKIDAKGRKKPDRDSTFDDLFFGSKSRLDPDGVRRVIKSVSEKGQDSDDDASITEIRRRASTAPVKKKGSISTVISNSQPSNGSVPQNDDSNRSNGTTGTIIKETTLESTPGSRPQTAGGAGIDSSQYLEHWSGSIEVTTPLKMSKPVINVPSSTRSAVMQAMETPAVRRSHDNSEESVPETSPVKGDGVESGEYRTAQESFAVDEIVDSSPVVVVHGRKRSHSGFVQSSIPNDATQPKRERPPKIHDDLSEEEILEPVQKEQKLPSPPPRKRRRTRTQTVESMEPVQSHIASPSGASVTERDSAMHRVFALFKDENRNYYPATVMEPPTTTSADQEVSLDTEVVVRFDDGTETSVKLLQIRRLQFQDGDTVRLTMPGAKKANYLVRRCETDPSESGNTDVDGNNVVIVTKKARGSTEELRVPIDQIYVTGILFAQFQQRRYLFTKDPLSRSRYVPMTLSRQVSSSPRVARPARIIGTIFQNMVFAMTVLGQDGQQRDKLTKAIRTHSGHVVDAGFEELFQPPEDVDGDLVLYPQWEATTFCAVIADGYSRKTKYIQALALGIPCLSSRWVESCIKQVFSHLVHELT
jgi:hypothetical protein